MNHLLVASFALVAFSAFSSSSILLFAADGPVLADIVIRRATIHDGSGAAPMVGDVAIRGDRIVAIGQFETAGEPRQINAEGLVVCPGFIDLHNHSDEPITRSSTRQNKNFLWQGCTTIVTGNCGGGRVDVAEYLAEVDKQGAGSNVAHLIPQGNVRQRIVGGQKRPATADEISRMKQLVDQGMRDGAFGMSTGLIYTPSLYADTNELIELSKVVASHGGIYASHMRNEGNRLLDSIQETLTIGQQAGLPVHISHFKVSGRSAWGIAPDAIQAVAAAREKGQRVTADQYPYIASSTSLAAMVVPDEYRTKSSLEKALADPDKAAQVKREIAQSIEARDGGKSLFIAKYDADESWQGKDLTTLAEKQNKPIVDLVVEIQLHGGAKVVSFGMKEEEVRLIMQQPYVATASDGSATNPDDTVPHPRSYGTFPRKIGRYAVDGKIMSLEQAIRSSSGLPAEILGLADRGLLKAGYAADVAIFDPGSFRDVATFEAPHQYATGIRFLFVNGKLAIDDGRLTDQLAGKALRKQRSDRAVGSD
jgi:N-acyl-D-amino-acid deacylase